MNEDIKRKVDDLIEQGYDFPVADFFRNAYALFRQSTGSFIGFFFLMMFITLFASSIPYLGFFLNSFIVGPTLLVGWYIFSDKLHQGQRPEFDSFFKGFEHLVQLMLVAIVTSFIIFLILSPTFYLIYKSGLFEWYKEFLENPLAAQDVPSFNFSPMDFLIIALNMIPVIYFSIAFMWAPLFVVFYGMPFWDAIEASRKLITRQWFSVFSFYLFFISAFIILGFFASILIALLSAAGVILGVLLLIGATLVFAPVFYIAIYLSFAEVTRLHELKSDDIFDHLVD